MNQDRNRPYPNSYLYNSQAQTGFPTYTTPIDRKRSILRTQVINSPSSLYSSQTMNNYRLMSPQQGKLSVRNSSRFKFPAVNISYSNAPQSDKIHQHINHQNMGDSSINHHNNNSQNSNEFYNTVNIKMQNTKSEIMMLSKKLDKMKNENSYLDPNSIANKTNQHKAHNQDHSNQRQEQNYEHSTAKVAISPLYTKDLSSSYLENNDHEYSRYNKFKNENQSLKSSNLSNQQPNYSAVKNNRSNKYNKVSHTEEAEFNDQKQKMRGSQQWQNNELIYNQNKSQTKLNGCISERSFTSEQRKLLDYDSERLEKQKKQLDNQKWKLQMQKSEFHMKHINYQLCIKEKQKLSADKLRMQAQIDSIKQKLVNKQIKQHNVKQQTKKEHQKLMKLQQQIKNKQLLLQSKAAQNMQILLISKQQIAEQQKLLELKKQQIKVQQTRISQQKIKNSKQSAKIQGMLENLQVKQQQFKGILLDYEAKKQQMLQWQKNIQSMKDQKKLLDIQNQQSVAQAIRENQKLAQSNQLLNEEQQMIKIRITQLQMQKKQATNIYGEQSAKYDVLAQQMKNLRSNFELQRSKLYVQMNLEGLKQQKANLVQQIGVSRQKLIEYQEQRQIQISQFEQTMRQLESQKSGMQEQMQKITQACCLKQNQMEALQNDCENFRNSLDNLKSECQFHIKRNQHETQIYHKVIEQKNGLTAELYKQKQMLEKSLNIVGIKNQSNQLLSELESRKTERQTLIDQVQQIRNQISSILEQKNTIVAMLENNRQQIDNDRQQIANNVRTIENQNGEINELNRVCSNISAQIGNLTGIVSELKQQQSQLVQWCANNQVVDSSQLQQLEQIIEEYRVNQSKLVKQNHEYGQMISGLNQQLARISHQNKQLRNEINYVRISQSALRAQNTGLKIELAEQTIKVKKLRQMEADLSKIGQLEKQNVHRGNIIAKLQGQLERKNSAVSAMKAGVSRHSQQIRKNMEHSEKTFRQFTKLQQKYSELQSQLAKQYTRKKSYMAAYDEALRTLWEYLTIIHAANEKDHEMMREYREQAQIRRSGQSSVHKQNTWLQILLELLSGNAGSKLGLQTEGEHKILSDMQHVLVRVKDSLQSAQSRRK